MKTPQITPAWNTGIYIGDGVTATPETQTTFKTLPINATFHFRDTQYPSFFDNCRKVSARCYVSIDDPTFPKMQVGTINVNVTPTGVWSLNQPLK